MTCPHCRHETPPDAEFCPRCGVKLALTCARCGTANAADHSFCKKCGQALGPATTGAGPARFASPEAYTPKHLAEKILTSKSALEGERKQVTVLFADLKGSMELLADRDPEEARKLLDPVLERMMEAVHRYEGTVNQVMGDGIMALFGAPLAHEDHAVRACYAALRMQESVRRYGEEVRRAAGVPIHIRIGLNSGEVVVRSIGSDLRMDYTAVGQTTHVAARMEQAAMPGSILIPASTLRLAEGYVQVKPLGPIPVKGLAEPLEAYEAVGAGPARSRLQAGAARGLSRFVGRESELGQLGQALERAGRGHGQVVAVVGEPGVGKSRLYWEFTHSHRTQGWLCLESASVSYGKATAYLPIIELLRAYFQIEPRDDTRRIREKITGKLLALDRALEPSLPALLGLLDVPVEDAAWQALDPPQRRQRTLDAVKRLVLRESQVQPLLLLFEDLHWIDAETQVLLDSLMESLPTARLLLLVNYRPEYQHGWGSKTYYRQLRIDPLSPESAEELLRALLGDAPALAPLKRLLIARTDGNPFFLEESVRALVETRVIEGDPGVYRLVKELSGIQVPATVQAILAARIDRLPPEDKQLLQSAAVVGKDVPLPLLQAVADLSDDALARGLGRLQSAEFLYEASLFPEPEYTFKHALTHEVTYQSLLQERQRALHARIVTAIERLYADRLTEHVERLAHHALRSSAWEKAVGYLRQAGQKAVARSANREAVAFFEQALGVLTQLAGSRDTRSDELDLRIALGPALMAIKGTGVREVEESYLKAQSLSETLADTSRRFPVVWGLWYINYSRGRYANSRDLAARLLAVAEQRGDTSLILEAHHSHWATLVGMGDLVSARHHFQEGLRLYDPGQHRFQAFLYGGHDPGVCCRRFRALSLWHLGYPDQAVTGIQDALSLARELAHPQSIVIAHYFAALIHLNRGETRAATDKAEAALELAVAQEFVIWVDAVTALRARLTADDDPEEGLPALEAAMARSSGWRRVLQLCFLAELHGKRGEPDRGLARLDEALALVQSGVGYAAPEVHRVRGELLLAQGAGGDRGEAEAAFLRALEIARAREERSLELRAATSLARLLYRDGRRDEARRTLGDVYGWFTEGFDTRDLKEARTLLDELAEGE